MGKLLTWKVALMAMPVLALLYALLADLHRATVDRPATAVEQKQVQTAMTKWGRTLANHP